MPPDATTGLEDIVEERIDALVNAIRSLHHQEARGELAGLRRMDTDRAVEPAFQRILVRVVPNASFRSIRRNDDAGRLALVTKILALGTDPDVLADGHRNLGEVMAAQGIKERRVQVLMTARGPALDDLLLRLSRQLVRGGSLPFLDLGRLVLGSAESIEKTRFRIAQGYWRALDAKGAPNDQAPQGEAE
jgi:hypothetical protein